MNTVTANLVDRGDVPIASSSATNQRLNLTSKIDEPIASDIAANLDTLTVLIREFNKPTKSVEPEEKQHSLNNELLLSSFVMLMAFIVLCLPKVDSAWFDMLCFLILIFSAGYSYKILEKIRLKNQNNGQLLKKTTN